MSVARMGVMNLGRRKLRSGLVIGGVALGIMLVLSLSSMLVGLQSAVNTSLNLLAGSLTIQQKGTVDQSMSVVNMSVLYELERTPYLEGRISPQIWVYRQFPEGFFGILPIAGILPSREVKTTDVLKKFVSGRIFQDGESGVAVLGEELSRKLKIEAGGELAVPGSALVLKVTGVFSAGSSWNWWAFISLEDARRITNMKDEQVSVLIARPDAKHYDEFRRYVEGRYQELMALSPIELTGQFGQLLDLMSTVTLVITAIVLVIGGLGVINVMIMSINERIGELGLLKAVGWSNWNVGLLILYESLGIGAIGGLAGAFAGVTLVQLANTYISSVAYFEAEVSVVQILLALLFALGLSAVGGAYPTHKAVKLSPVKAITGE